MKLTLVDKIVLLSGTVILAVAIACMLSGCQKARPVWRTTSDSLEAVARQQMKARGEIVAAKIQTVESHYNFLMSGFESETVFYLVTADGRKLQVELAEWATTSIGDTVHTERNWN